MTTVHRRLIATYAEQYKHDVGHARQVARISEELFGVLAPMHGLGAAERELLFEAALLHDIGWCGGQQQHHKRAFELIMSDPPGGYSERDLAIVANVARYHRKALPSLSHEGFARLNEPDREIVRRLAAIIRVADGLDVSHSDLVKVVGCEIGPDMVTFELSTNGSVANEMEAAEEKSDLFREVYGVGISFRASEEGAK